MSSHRPHFPIATLTYNGNLIITAAQNHPEIAPRLPANYVSAAGTLLGKITADVAGQKTAKGELGNLTTAQQAALDELQHCASTDSTTSHPVADVMFPNSPTAIRDSTGSTTAHPVGNAADLQRLDLSKYDVVTVVAFGVEPGTNIDPIYGEKFAADVFGRLKHDFGNLFTEVRFGDPEGQTNELVVTGNLKAYSEATVTGIIFQGLPVGKAKLEADLILRDGATQQTIFTAEVNKLWGTEEWLRGAEDVQRKREDAAATVANTIARGRGWQPAGQSK
jgi:hypothetical protein